MKNKLLIVLAVMVMLLAFPFTNTSVVSAAALTAVVDTPTSLVAGVTATHSVVFTTASAGAIKSIGVVFPAGFNVAGAGISGYVTTDGAATPVVSVASQTVTVTFGTASTGAAGGITYTLPLTGIVNTSTSGNATVSVTTNTVTPTVIDGPTTSAVFLVAPAALSDLSCISSGSAGAVWLRWTAPTGVSAGYEARTSLATITSGNYSSANIFTQSPAWASGTVGVIQQQLVTALTPNTLYFFNVKALGGNSSTSAVANTVYCTAPTSSVSVRSDSTAPASSITDPTASQGILLGTPYTIKGTSSDTGGSSVVKVEISTDGTTWNVVNPLVQSGTGYTWNYVWNPTKTGANTIQTRATDGFGNIETPSAGVNVVVGTASTLPTVTVTTGGVPATTGTTTTTTTTTTPASSGLPYTTPVGSDQINANISYLQQQLIVLLQQLLASLQAQLGR